MGSWRSSHTCCSADFHPESCSSNQAFVSLLLQFQCWIPLWGPRARPLLCFYPSYAGVLLSNSQPYDCVSLHTRRLPQLWLQLASAYQSLGQRVGFHWPLKKCTQDNGLLLTSESALCFLSPWASFLSSARSCMESLSPLCSPPWFEQPQLCYRGKDQLWSLNGSGGSGMRELEWQQGTEHLGLKKGRASGGRGWCHWRLGNESLSLGPSSWLSLPAQDLTFYPWKFAIVFPPNKWGCCREKVR